MTSSEANFYTTPSDHLEQGDIFYLDLVAPIADEIKRIFRTEDGRHGSLFFEGNARAKVFSQSELEELLQTSNRTELHTDPFRETLDGQQEMVVVAGRLFQYFIIASQTCDISGKNGKSLPWAIVLPIITISYTCKNQCLPFKSIDDQMTIHDFICSKLQDSEKLQSATEFEYGEEIRNITSELLEKKNNGKILEDIRQIKNFLNNYHKKGYMFPLTEKPDFKVPESYVDFTAAYSVPTDKLLSVKENRFARINTPYREDFAQHFANFFARVALPTPMKPKDV